VDGTQNKTDRRFPIKSVKKVCFAYNSHAARKDLILRAEQNEFPQLSCLFWKTVNMRDLRVLFAAFICLRKLGIDAFLSDSPRFLMFAENAALIMCILLCILLL